MTQVVEKAQRRIERLRREHGWLDHVFRAAERFSAANAGRLAGACTYYGFLAIFPLLLLAFSVLGFVFAGHPEITAQVSRTLSQNLPFISVDDIVKARGTAGIIGLVGFFFAGLGWVDCTRGAIRAIWQRPQEPGNPVVRKLADAGILLALGLVLGLSFLVSAVLSGGTHLLLQALGQADSTAGSIALQAVGIVLGLAVNVVFFIALLSGLPQLRIPFRVVIWPALLSAAGFTLLRTLGVLYISRTQANPAYQAVAVSVGILLFLFYLNQLMLFCSALTATDDRASATEVDPYDAKTDDEKTVVTTKTDHQQQPPSPLGASPR
ncbi:YihY/virulence factor BrkB family protein [Fodinicola acaciae]|uniref:YihY/virulence factor BrkB family protein n=1 Tax=Fodinicola acaciae TaxID=2681555 RepID=UPI0013D4C39A|nr:YihY/virulence factor BrkB family protein [Fodinicola acaciae]